MFHISYTVIENVSNVARVTNLNEEKNKPNVKLI